MYMNDRRTTSAQYNTIQYNTMELKQIILYLCVCTVACYPSKPLNDRPSELAWQAWLLVDAQNHASETDRRITPKSVFIAPNIGNGPNNGSLPDCADGYRSDPMGRCIKYVKVDEAAHLDFLLQRLNAMYATRPTEELDDETKPTSGPLQVNIPLGSGFPSKPDPDPEVAIIVAPTNGNFDNADDKKDADTTDTEPQLAIFVAPLNRNFDSHDAEYDSEIPTDRKDNKEKDYDEYTDSDLDVTSTRRNFSEYENKDDEMEIPATSTENNNNNNNNNKKENDDELYSADTEITSTIRNEEIGFTKKLH